ncbi:MAG: hypothetical protein ACT4O9_00440 [Blastocatellia bacterium]
MRKLIDSIAVLGFVLIVVVSVSAQAAEDKRVEPFVSEECGFSVLFPAKPKLDTDVLDTASARKYLTYSYYVSDQTETQYEVVCMELTPDRLKGGAAVNLGSYYNEAILPYAEKVLRKTALRPPNGVGLEFYVEYGTSYFRRGKVMIIGTRLYRVEVNGTREQTASAKAKHFIDSFKLSSQGRN